MSSRRRRRPRRGGRANTGAELAFWGRDAEDDDDEMALIAGVIDPTAMMRSLGSLPLPGREHIAEHYLASVYEKAAGLALALAATADLLDDGQGGDAS
jgi:hypothetical protein